MEKFFNIESLNNTYGNVSGFEENDKYYLTLDDYSGFTKVEISKEAFYQLYKQFGNDVSVDITDNNSVGNFEDWHYSVADSKFQDE